MATPLVKVLKRKNSGILPPPTKKQRKEEEESISIGEEDSWSSSMDEETDEEIGKFCRVDTQDQWEKRLQKVAPPELWQEYKALTNLYGEHQWSYIRSCLMKRMIRNGSIPTEKRPTNSHDL